MNIYVLLIQKKLKEEKKSKKTQTRYKDNFFERHKQYPDKEIILKSSRSNFKNLYGI